jgi:hypothetical protein
MSPIDHFNRFNYSQDASYLGSSGSDGYSSSDDMELDETVGGIISDRSGEETPKSSLTPRHSPIRAAAPRQTSLTSETFTIFDEFAQQEDLRNAGLLPRPTPVHLKQVYVFPDEYVINNLAGTIRRPLGEIPQSDLNCVYRLARFDGQKWIVENTKWWEALEIEYSDELLLAQHEPLPPLPGNGVRQEEEIAPIGPHPQVNAPARDLLRRAVLIRAANGQLRA